MYSVFFLVVHSLMGGFYCSFGGSFWEIAYGTDNPSYQPDIGRFGESMYVYMYVCKYVWMDGWMNELMDRWIDG